MRFVELLMGIRLIAALCVIGSSAWSQESNMTVHLDQDRQTIEGFGGSIAYWAEETDEEAIRYATEDMGATIVRLRGDQDYREMPPAWKRLLAVAPDVKILMSFWHPYSEEHPDKHYWVEEDETESGEHRYQLKAIRFDEYAESLVTRVKRWRDEWKMPIIALSPQNEANYREFCFWAPGKLAIFIRDHLIPRMNAAGLGDLPLVAPELAFLSRDAWGARHYHDVNALPDVAVVAYHIYDVIKPVEKNGDPTYPIDSLRTHQRALATYMNENFGPSGTRTKRLWMTETSGAWPQRMGWRADMTEHERALVAAQYVHAVIHDAEANAFLWWGLIYRAEPTGNATAEKTQKFRDAGLVLLSRNAKEGVHPFQEVTRKFYTVKQYSKFIRPGFVRLKSQASGPAWMSAYRSPDSQQVIIVAINTTSNPSPLTLSFSGGTAPIVQSAVVTDKAQLYQDMRWAGILNPRSVTTLVLSSE